MHDGSGGDCNCEHLKSAHGMRVMTCVHWLMNARVLKFCSSGLEHASEDCEDAKGNRLVRRMRLLLSLSTMMVHLPKPSMYVSAYSRTSLWLISRCISMSWLTSSVVLREENKKDITSFPANTKADQKPGPPRPSWCVYSVCLIPQRLSFHNAYQLVQVLELNQEGPSLLSPAGTLLCLLLTILILSALSSGPAVGFRLAFCMTHVLARRIQSTCRFITCCMQAT